MNMNPNDKTLLAARARRAARRPTTIPATTFRRIPFAEARAYAELNDRRDGEVQDYLASFAASVLDERMVWHLFSDGQEWLADVWVDSEGRYHIARDLDTRTELPVERSAA